MQKSRIEMGWPSIPGSFSLSYAHDDHVDAVPVFVQSRCRERLSAACGVDAVKLRYLKVLLFNLTNILYCCLIKEWRSLSSSLTNARIVQTSGMLPRLPPNCPMKFSAS
jgi:hypothetical protein